jgi:hypothetical protein
MKQLDRLSHTRRKAAPRDSFGGKLSPSGCFTQKVAARRRLEMQALVLQMIPGEELMRLLLSERPPSIPELISIAQRRAAEHAGKCQHCGKPLPPTTTTTTTEDSR